MPPRTALAPQAPVPAHQPARTGLHAGFLRSADGFPDRPALEVTGETLTYAGLRERAAGLAATLVRHSGQTDPPLVAVYAYRTPTAFVAVLGTLLRGHGYVPLNPSLPAARNRLMLGQAGCRVLVADAASVERLDEVLRDLADPLTIVVPDAPDVAGLSDRWPGHTILGADQLEPAAAWEPAAADPSDIAYVLFTSGSTGIPKGVTVTHGNATWIVETMVERYGVTEEDRISQTHEFTFDVSVWDMFVTWERGACLCCPTTKELIKPGAFIRNARLSIWFSVPSTAILMKRLGMLKPDSYPALRYSLFAGEPLPMPVAEAWLEAAPHSTVENLYGPTELTIVCMEYRWDRARSPGECEAGVVPIGWPLRGNRPLVVDAELCEVAPGQDGELLMSGPQVTGGYWRDPERSDAAFIAPRGHSDIHYRTGDRVRRPARPDAPMTYLGRLDNQIKVRGVRVELGEVEAVLRDETGVDAVVAMGWPVTSTGADGVVAFVADTSVDLARTDERLRARLPVHMVPREIHLVSELPLNASGKFDRLALRASLEAGA